MSFFSGADGEPLQEEDYFLSNPYHLVCSWIWLILLFITITWVLFNHVSYITIFYFLSFHNLLYVHMSLYPEDHLQLMNMLIEYTFIWLICNSCEFSPLKYSKNLLKIRTEGRIVSFKLHTQYYVSLCCKFLCVLFLPYQLSHMTWRNTVTQK